jgi:lipoprotein-anchoring transpeptidase ErfK/SrfK
LKRAALVRGSALAAVALLVGGGGLAAQIIASGRALPPAELRSRALAAHEASRAAPGARWAPDELRGADAALGEALVEYSRQQARPLVFRDFRPAARALQSAEAAAQAAERAGAARRDDALAAASDAVQQSGALEDHALALVAATSLPAPQRSRLAGARLLLREARAHLAAGDPQLALERAESAESELRTALGPALLAAGRYTEKEQVETWKRWIEEARRQSRVSGEPEVLVLKEKNLLVLLSRGEPLRRYPAEIGKNALASKRQRGDRATPEGRYRIVEKKDVGHSSYHRALLLDYPNAADRERFDAAKRRGEIQKGAAIGGQIEIHGEGGRGQNWTDGCVALANADIDDLFARVRPGTRVTIVGGEGSDGAFSSLLARVKTPGEGS